MGAPKTTRWRRATHRGHAGSSSWARDPRKEAPKWARRQQWRNEIRGGEGTRRSRAAQRRERENPTCEKMN
eukprot:7368561-Pyramimonas_sp.AAC.1